MVKAKREDPPHALLAADFEEICAVYGVTGDDKRSLGRALSHAIRLCHQDHARQDREPDRRVVREELDRIAKALRALEQSARDRPRVFAEILEAGLGNRLAMTLSNEACSRIVGERFEPQAKRALEARDPARALRTAAHQMRMNLVEDAGTDVYIGLLRLLREPIEQERAARSATKGGGPARVYRNLLVLSVFRWNAELPETNRRTDRDLEELLETILESVGVDTEGLQDAYRRIRDAVS